MKKSIIFLALFAAGGTVWAGGDDEIILTNLLEKYRNAEGKRQIAYNELKAAERSQSSGQTKNLTGVYSAYEKTSIALEQLLLQYPKLAAYITNMERPCTPDEITSSSPFCRASSPGVPT